MRIQWIIWLVLTAGLISGVTAASQDTDATKLLEIADEMVQTTARLRGLEPKAPIKSGIKSRDEISRYLRERVAEEYSQEMLQREGQVLRKLGLIPDSLDYTEFILKLLTEQVGGFYDPEKKVLYIASWLSAEEQKPIMVHELTHALQDQHFNVMEILKEDRDLNQDDRVLAHQALFEGEGMVLMLQYILEPLNRHFSGLPDLADIMRKQMSTMQSQFEVFKSAPMFIQETLLFPYGYGASFLQRAWQRNPDWASINEIYSDLPASTEQIIHPEKYFADRDDPKTVNAEADATLLGDNWNIAYKNVLGEFSLGILLNLHLTEERARKSAAGWGGDQLLLLENESDQDAVLLTTVWDTADDADRFFAAMDEWFRRRYPDAARTYELAAGFSISDDGEFNSLLRDGSTVRVLIGFPEEDGRILNEFLMEKELIPVQ